MKEKNGTKELWKLEGESKRQMNEGKKIMR